MYEHKFIVPDRPEVIDLFRQRMVDVAGGATIATDGLEGFWKDDTGRLHVDRVRACYVACDNHALAQIQTAFWGLFPDQLVLYRVTAGHANFIANPHKEI